MCGTSASKPVDPFPEVPVSPPDPTTSLTRPFKVITVGPSGVGKSILLHRLITGEYNLLPTTLGVDYHPLKIPVHGSKTPLNLMLWDTAGQEKYRSLTYLYYRDADVVLLTFCPAEGNFIDSKWFSEISHYAAVDAVMLLVRTKIDMEVDGKVLAGIHNIEEKDEWNVPEGIQERLGFVVYNVSAKEGWGIDLLKAEIAKKCFMKRKT
eukprot:TRINITY_DN26112_c0_g1_i1.p1 TRINITY_DN26112_c0_g1~~TRINITY_DN26112_c0_g1_i1.p1  ORF type:complete len:226 (+),score=59.54 TRINITY_DN26112_c0_g1_i1:55-678(+)